MIGRNFLAANVRYRTSDVFSLPVQDRPQDSASWLRVVNSVATFVLISLSVSVLCHEIFYGKPADLAAQFAVGGGSGHFDNSMNVTRDHGGDLITPALPGGASAARVGTY